MDTLRPYEDTVSPCFAVLARTLKGEGEGGGEGGGNEPNVEELQQQLQSANEKIQNLEASSQDWKKQIDSDPDNNPNLKKYETPADLWKAHTSLLSKLGDQASLIRPPKDAEDKEGWENLAKSLGVPEKPEDYQFPDVKRPEGMDPDKTQEEQYRQLAHKYKLAPWQAEGLYKEVVESNAKQFAELQGQAEKQAKDIESEMATEYGAAWPEKKESAQKVIDTFAPNDSEISTKILNDPAAVKLFVKLGEKLSEDGIIGESAGTGRLSPKEARSEINKILNDEKHPYHNSEAAGHKEAVDYMTNLYEMESAGNK